MGEPGDGQRPLPHLAARTPGHRGERDGSFKHGYDTAEAILERRRLASVLAAARSALSNIREASLLAELACVSSGQQDEVSGEALP